MKKTEMKKLAYLLTVSVFLIIASGSCRKSFLEVEPAGALSEFNLASNEGINGLLIGACILKLVIRIHTRLRS
jgi:hypothetical protein